MLIPLPYGKGGAKEIEIPDKNITAILSPPEAQSTKTQEELVEVAFSHPLGRLPLHELAKGKKSVAIVVSDASRPNIERIVFPRIMEELSKAGIAESDIRLIIGTGSHRQATTQEIEEMFGSFHHLDITSHNCWDSPLIHLGETKTGVPIVLNKRYYEAELKIVIGTVLPHPIAGYSGGGKGIAVGVGGFDVLSSIHTPSMLEEEGTGLAQIENNPFLEALYEIGDRSGLDFVINGVFNHTLDLMDLAVGEMREVHRTLIDRTASRLFEVYFSKQADIVVVAVGHPKDGNLYHLCAEGVCIVAGPSIKVPVVKKGGTIIIVSPGQESGYNDIFFQKLCGSSPQDIIEWGKNPETIKIGEHRAYGTARVLCDHEVLFAETMLHPSTIEKIHCQHYSSFQDALSYALNRHGEDASIMVLKESYRLIPQFTGN